MWKCKVRRSNRTTAFLRQLVWAFGLMAPTLGVAGTQPYPTKPVRVIVPFGPGGMPDLVARAVGERLSKSLGQPFIVDNRPGAGGNTGAAIVARATPDGYHMLLTPGSVITINPGLYARMPFDPAVAFVPVSLVVDMPIILVVNARYPAKDIAQFIQIARRDSDKTAFSSPGVGSVLHLAGELLQRAAGVTMPHVPYKSGGESVTAVLSGQVAGTFTNLPVVYSHLKAGTLRALGVGTTSRMSQLPDVPTMAEGGLRGFEVTSWAGFMMPARTSRELVQELSGHIAKTLREPDVQARFTEMGVHLVGSTPDEFAGFIRMERMRWEEVLRSANIRLD